MSVMGVKVSNSFHNHEIDTIFGQICCMMKHFFFKIFGNMEKIPTFVLETNRLGNG